MRRNCLTEWFGRGVKPRPGVGCSFAAALAVFALSACAPLVATAPVDPRPGWIGFIASIEGPNAFVDLGNSGAGRTAKLGETLLPGDRFFTGNGTRMKVEFAKGGYVELDENTDPRLFQELKCVLIDLFSRGRMFVDKDGACVEWKKIVALAQSKVVYEVKDAGGLLQVTVVKGQVRLQPPGVTASAAHRIDVDSQGVVKGPYPVTEQEILDSISWTRHFRDAQQSVSPWIPFAVIGVLGVIMGTIDRNPTKGGPPSVESPVKKQPSQRPYQGPN